MAQKCYCMKCKTEVEEAHEGICPQENCECKTFVFADNNDITFNEQGAVVCQCGSVEFKNTLHMDLTTKYVNNYQCCGCGRTIGTEGYRDPGDPMMEDY